MRMDGLEPLYRSMRAQNIGRTKFRYQHNHLAFECLFTAPMKNAGSRWAWPATAKCWWSCIPISRPIPLPP